MRQALRQTWVFRVAARAAAACATLALCATLTACSSAPSRPPEYLDPDTAASVTTVTTPIVFARAHQDVAANARQYVTVAAVSVNRSGHFDYVLLVYLWSTVDPRLGAHRHPGQNIILLADDRAIRLVRDGSSLHQVGISAPLHAPEHMHGQPRIYRTDLETLKFLGQARRMRLLLEGDEDPRPFDVWTDGRAALKQFASVNQP